VGAANSIAAIHTPNNLQSKQTSIQQTKTSSMMNSEVSQDKENQNPNLLNDLALDGRFVEAEEIAAGSGASAIDYVSCFC
jgi:hypothetical protein